jgi:hypothetical protein
MEDWIEGARSEWKRNAWKTGKTGWMETLTLRWWMDLMDGGARNGRNG